MDFIFLRNDTFIPMPVMPIVIALQNPSAAKLLLPYLTYGLGPVGDDILNSSREFSNFGDFEGLSANTN